MEFVLRVRDRLRLGRGRTVGMPATDPLFHGFELEPEGFEFGVRVGIRFGRVRHKTSVPRAASPRKT